MPKSKSPENAPCPCGSGERYAECCRIYHQGTEAPDAPALMRSRFSAFALSEVDYLIRTLGSSNPEHFHEPLKLRRELLETCKATRFVRLRVLDTRSTSPTTAQVLFHAEMYRSGKEVSFAELSEFVREAAGWRYAGGDSRAMKATEVKAPYIEIEPFLKSLLAK